MQGVVITTPLTFLFTFAINSIFHLYICYYKKITPMETKDITGKKVHHGHNVKRLRQSRGIKQQAIAHELELSQQVISKYEQMEELDEEILQKFAKALDISVDVIKMLEEDPVAIYIENNTFESVNDNAKINVASDDSSTNTFNELDKVIELYERLLKTEQERNTALEDRLSKLEEKLNGKK